MSINLTLRATKGNPLSHAEMDANFTALKAGVENATSSVVSETPPSNPNAGSKWYIPSVGITYVWDVTNGNGSWVEEPVSSFDGQLRKDLASANSTVPIAGVSATDLVTRRRRDIREFGIVFDGTDEGAKLRAALTSGNPLYFPPNKTIIVGGDPAAPISDAGTTSVVMGRNGNALQVQRSYLEPTIAPTLLNSWVNGSPSNRSTAGYFKDDKGIVHLQGYLSGGASGTVAFQLPVGYRPPLGVEIAAATNGSNGRVTIVNDGNVTIASFTSWIALDGITFRAA